MIVLDEQLLGYGLQASIGQWYRGMVTDLTQLRPDTQIHDDAVATLLRAERQPTFVTINVTDFWRQMAPEEHFSIVCFALPHSRAREISGLLRRLFALEPFQTRRARRTSWRRNVNRVTTPIFAPSPRIAQKRSPSW